ncbi:MAG: Pr6Pr family membrane protein [Oscillospiraceae bacterium]
MYFTNLSNYICAAVMLAELIQSTKAAQKGESGFASALPVLKFFGAVMITITFVVFNFLLAKGRPIEKNLTVSSIMFHQVLPVMYIIDWVLFYEHKKVKWHTPLLSLVIPLIYAIFIFIRAEIMHREGELVYPYFFLDVNTLGWGGVGVWIAVLIAGFIAVGYIFFMIDKMIKPKNDME